MKRFPTIVFFSLLIISAQAFADSAKIIPSREQEDQAALHTIHSYQRFVLNAWNQREELERKARAFHQKLLETSKSPVAGEQVAAATPPAATESKKEDEIKKPVTKYSVDLDDSFIDETYLDCEVAELRSKAVELHQTDRTKLNEYEISELDAKLSVIHYLDSLDILVSEAREKNKSIREQLAQNIKNIQRRIADLLKSKIEKELPELEDLSNRTLKGEAKILEKKAQDEESDNEEIERHQSNLMRAQKLAMGIDEKFSSLNYGVSVEETLKTTKADIISPIGALEEADDDKDNKDEPKP